MRTTLQIDDDVLLAAKSLARAEKTTLGSVISRLARRGLAPRPQEESHADFPVFSVARDAPPISDETVRRALDDE